VTLRDDSQLGQDVPPLAGQHLLAGSQANNNRARERGGCRVSMVADYSVWIALSLKEGGGQKRLRRQQNVLESIRLIKSKDTYTSPSPPDKQ